MSCIIQEVRLSDLVAPPSLQSGVFSDWHHQCTCWRSLGAQAIGLSFTLSCIKNGSNEGMCQSLLDHVF